MREIKIYDKIKHASDEIYAYLKKRGLNPILTLFNEILIQSLDSKIIDRLNSISEKYKLKVCLSLSKYDNKHYFIINFTEHDCGNNFKKLEK